VALSLLRDLVDGLIRAMDPMERVASDVLTMGFSSHIPLPWRSELLITPLWCSDQDRRLSGFGEIDLSALLRFLAPVGRRFRGGIIDLCFDSFSIITGVPCALRLGALRLRRLRSAPLREVADDVIVRHKSVAFITALPFVPVSVASLDNLLQAPLQELTPDSELAL
jgi:hypothetical protein